MKRKISLALCALTAISIMLGAVGVGGCSNTVTVEFVTYSKEEIAPVEYKIDDYYRKLPTPEREGYEFLGWFTQEVGGELIKGGNKTSKKTKTLYARWLAHKNRIAADRDCAFVIDDGNLWGWGVNEYSQLGDGTTENITKPKQIMQGTKFKEISVGGSHNHAIDVDGNLWVWGASDYGILGDGVINDSPFYCTPTPKRILENVKFKDIRIGNFNITIDVDGNLWSWGYGLSGMLGDGTETTRAIPQIIMQGTKFKSVSNLEQSAIDENGNMWIWGSNYWGRLGNNSNERILTPIIHENVYFAGFSVGTFHSVGIDNSGNFWTVGRNLYGALGNGEAADTMVPIRVYLNK